MIQHWRERTRGFMATSDLSDRRIHLALITVLWAAVYPYIAYVGQVRPWDEGEFYYPTALRMVEHGQWLIPHLNAGTPFLEKPPLGLWFQAVSMEIFGPTLFAARFPSTIFGLATALLVYHIARTLYGWRAGFIGGILFLVIPQVSMHNHSAVTADLDAYLVFFSALFMWLVWRHPDDRRMMAVAGVAGAAAVLSKSFAPGFALLALAPVVVVRWRRYLRPEPAIGALVGLAVLLPWPVFAYYRASDVFLNDMILREIGRAQGQINSGFPYLKFVTGFDIVFGETVGTFHPFVLRLSYPILIALAGAGLLVAYRRGEARMDPDAILAWWAVSVPLFFQIVNGPHGWYLFPVIVPLAILSARSVDRAIDLLGEPEALPRLTDRHVVTLAVLGYVGVYIAWFLVSNAPKSGACPLC